MITEKLRRRGSIRGQILAALIAVMLVAAGVASVGMVVMLRAERDFRALAEDHIPAAALAGELAEATGDLAALAVRMMAEPAQTGTELSEAMERAARSVAGVLGSPLLAATPERSMMRIGIEAASEDLWRALLAFDRYGADLARLTVSEVSADSDLRWTHSDVQDQAQGLLRDLSFNMDARLAVLVSNFDQSSRAMAESALTQDRRLRDRLQQLGAEAATLTALLLQARAAGDAIALDHAEALGRDTLDLLALTQLNLPERADVSLFLEALTSLTALASGEDSIFAQARKRLTLRQGALLELQEAQEALLRMQSALTEFGRIERIAAQSRADLAAAAILRGSLALTLVTLLGVALAGAILAVFVHHRILRRIEHLSADLSRIARGDLTGPAMPEGQDEIAGMARAVEVFRASVLDRQRVIERLELTQRELVQAGKMAALGQMSAAISHEINQPLAAIGHRLHNLRAAHPETRPALERIEALVNRITRTIAHLRRIARRAEHHHTRIRLAEPLEAALELLEHRLRDERVSLDLPDLSQVTVAGDEILLEQVLLSILGNALDAIAETGRGAGRIEISLIEGEALELLIRDNGAGLGGQSGAALIDPFFTTKDPGKGLGLGLSIAFNVMQDMGGHLAISPHPECGAVVRLSFDRWREENDD